MLGVIILRLERLRVGLGREVVLPEEHLASFITSFHCEGAFFAPKNAFFFAAGVYSPVLAREASKAGYVGFGFVGAFSAALGPDVHAVDLGSW